MKEYSDVSSLFRCITLHLIKTEKTVTTMESCTSGLVASLLTDTEGASAVCPGTFVTYSNRAKVMQGVPAEIIETYGVYSAETAKAMAEVCRRTYQTDYGIGVTGSFGNLDPNNADSVTGTVFFALSSERGTENFKFFTGSQPTRLAYKLVTAEAVGQALWGMLNAR